MWKIRLKCGGDILFFYCFLLGIFYVMMKKKFTKNKGRWKISNHKNEHEIMRISLYLLTYFLYSHTN